MKFRLNDKYRFFVFIIHLLILWPFLAIQAENDPWKVVEQGQNLQAWSHKAIPGSFAIKILQEKNSHSTLRSYGKDAFYHLFVKTKKKYLKKVGISKWNDLNHTWKKHKDFELLTVKGHYTNKDGKKIYFIEKNFYSKAKAYQILYSQPGSIKALNKEEIKQFFQREEMKL